MKKATFGVIVGNRDFFPDRLSQEGRETVLRVLEEEGYGAVCLEATQGTGGSVQTYDDALACASLFREKAPVIDGILVTLPNFGDERAIMGALRLANLRVPVLVHAFPDDPQAMFPARRRDSFCGKISVCNNLRQAGIAFSLTAEHTMDPTGPGFRAELAKFASVCRVTRGLTNARIGAIGARPAAFNTVRYSEKLLEAAGISVETVDLSEIVDRAQKLGEQDRSVQEKLRAIRGFVDTTAVPPPSLVKMARLGAVIDEWVAEHHVQALAIQCWSALEKIYGVVPCTIMSMLSSSLVPAACEVDVTGALSMYVLQLASGQPGALVDWNNNYADDRDRAVVFHCSNLPVPMLQGARMEYPPILASVLGQASTYGTISGRLKAGPVTFARILTDDVGGRVRAYVAEGEATEDPLQTFGGYGVVRVPDLQGLLRYVCQQGFEHHVAMTTGSVGEAVVEAFDRYLKWDVYRHTAH